MSSDHKYLFPSKIDSYIRYAVRHFRKEGNDLWARVLELARYKLDLGAYYDNWDGGQHGHILSLAVNDELMEDIFDHKNDIEEYITKIINNISSPDNEFIHETTIELLTEEFISDKEINIPGLTKPKKEDIDRIWGNNEFLRLFISHKVEKKALAETLKRKFWNRGVTAFVAHSSIRPSREWQRDIEMALASMEACVALLTEDFNLSDWTDQELGIAIGRGVPIIAVNIGKIPYGFIGKYQALNGMNMLEFDMARGIHDTLLNDSRISSLVRKKLFTNLAQTKDVDVIEGIIKIVYHEFSSYSEDELSLLKKVYNRKEVDSFKDSMSKLKEMIGEIKPDNPYYQVEDDLPF